MQYEMKYCHSRSTLMIDNLQITDKSVDDKNFIHKYQSVTESLQFLTIYTRSDIVFAADWLAH